MYHGNAGLRYRVESNNHVQLLSPSFAHMLKSSILVPSAQLVSPSIPLIRPSHMVSSPYHLPPARSSPIFIDGNQYCLRERAGTYFCWLEALLVIFIPHHHHQRHLVRLNHLGGKVSLSIAVFYLRLSSFKLSC